MGPFIMVIVPVFHTVVFTGIAYWMSRSPQFKFPPNTAALWFVAGGVLANIVLCAMLLEVGSGMAMVAGQPVDDGAFSASMKVLLYTQPVFAFLLYPIVTTVLKLQRKSTVS